MTTKEVDRPERAQFPAARVAVGTNFPMIKADGEGPAREINVAAFELEVHCVSNRRFACFVAETGYVTEAENLGWSPVFFGLLPPERVRLSAAATTPWWVRVDGANWRLPEGPGSCLKERMDHPVVHVAWKDAAAFAIWADGRLPTEAEWVHAARGGLDDPLFPWGNEEPTDDKVLCNIWQGHFPWHNTLADGYFGTNPMDAFAPNGAGLYDMAGNVWEWTSDAFRVRSLTRNARLRNAEAARSRQRVLKGGSFLCHKSYCFRYRIAARIGLPEDSAASNVGFRIAYHLNE